MRYFAEIAYNGTGFNGWQVQPDKPTVQTCIEDAMSKILRQPVSVLGCGRTDTGVHASQYFLHFDVVEALPERFEGRLNRLLPKDIAFRRIIPVAEEAHARFDAQLRSYTYIIDTQKNPFSQQGTWYLHVAAELDIQKLQAAADLLLEFEEFAPFCKTHSDALTMRCQISRAEWIWNAELQQWHFHISANRFLRGMVRLIVGMCINVALGQLSLAAVREALTQQTALPKSYSVPPDGLYLSKVEYDFL